MLPSPKAKAKGYALREKLKWKKKQSLSEGHIPQGPQLVLLTYYYYYLFQSFLHVLPFKLFSSYLAPLITTPPPESFAPRKEKQHVLPGLAIDRSSPP